MDKTGKHSHDCLDTIARVVLSLDGNLTEAQEKQFLDDVNCCSYCLEKYSIEKSFKEFLRQKIAKHKPDPVIITKIRNRIKSGI